MSGWLYFSLIQSDGTVVAVAPLMAGQPKDHPGLEA